MAIKRINNKLVGKNHEDVEVGKNGVVSIDLTNHGNETTTIYLIKYEDREPLYLGFLEHEVEYIEEQTTIFDYLQKGR